MKKIFLGIISLSLLAACNSNPAKTAGTTANAKNAAVIKFETDVYDFGKINSGDKVTHQYKFENKGATPLIISDSYASCGCTQPEWPHTPIKPGESGIIKVTFNSAGKSGLQDKQITVVANTVPANTVVHLIGEVLEPKK